MDPMRFNFDFLFKKQLIPDIIEKRVRKKKQIIYGAQALKMQLPGFLSFTRQTKDYDILSSNPRQEANIMQALLDKKIAGGKNLFFSRPAKHPGTHKVLYVGPDGIPNTKDDEEIADYTKKTRPFPPTKIINGIRYERISHIKKGKIKTIKDPESRYRHEKDIDDLQLIGASEILRRPIRFKKVRLIRLR